ncbi:MAG: sigma-54 dependent transcriptional regulator [Candidatus Zixiibacteriota bacterium]
MARILIIDDEEQIRTSLKSALERRNHEIVTAENLAQGRQFAQAGFDLVFLDVMLPDGNGLDLLEELLARDSRQIVVMISGHSDIDTAVKAIRVGAYDFIEKPISLDRVLITIDNATRTTSLISEKDRLTSAVYGNFVGRSEPILRLIDEVHRSAPKATRFLITGENGTGKELVAHMIHQRSRFADGPFVAVNCAALPSELVESELFGHSAGAFTGAVKARKGKFVEANGGSIFLDEISEMPLAAQAKILRVIETKQITPVGQEKPVTVECNIIAASNRDLIKMVADKSFRQDLLYRINAVQFKLLPIRERREDIVPIAEHFLQLFANETKTRTKTLSAETQQLLRSMDFPGNVRELKNLMERVNIYCDADTILPADIESLLPRSSTSTPQGLKEAVSQFERDFIKTALARNGGNVTQTARELGLERSHLYKKLRKFDS